MRNVLKRINLRFFFSLRDMFDFFLNIRSKLAWYLDEFRKKLCQGGSASLNQLPPQVPNSLRMLSTKSTISQQQKLKNPFQNILKDTVISQKRFGIGNSFGIKGLYGAPIISGGQNTARQIRNWYKRRIDTKEGAIPGPRKLAQNGAAFTTGKLGPSQPGKTQIRRTAVRGAGVSPGIMGPIEGTP